MAKNERTSEEVAKIAGEVLRKGRATPKQAMTLAGSVLTQAADKPKPKPKAKPKAKPKPKPKPRGKRKK